MALQRVISATSIRSAAALAHVVPGVALELVFESGDVLTVAHRRLDAQLDPCQFRYAIIAGPCQGVPSMVDALLDVRVMRGVEHLGAGLVRRQGRDGEERWFATELEYEAVMALFEECPLDIPDESMSITVLPDTALGVSLVRIAANHPSMESCLDTIGFWGVTETIVAELIDWLRRETPL